MVKFYSFKVTREITLRAFSLGLDWLPKNKSKCMVSNINLLEKNCRNSSYKNWDTPLNSSKR
eukprot:m.307380 g.307380  ORF g.307380 m.307380 type:complete len:62 (+) comp42214_c0_seq1:309-494(+)